MHGWNIKKVLEAKLKLHTSFKVNTMYPHAVKWQDICCGPILKASGSCESSMFPFFFYPHTYTNTWSPSCFLTRHSLNSFAQSTTSAPLALNRKQNQNLRWPTSLRLTPACPLSFFYHVPNWYIVLYCSFRLRFYPLQLSLNSHFVLLHTIPLFLCRLLNQSQGPGDKKTETIASLRVISFLFPASELTLTYGLHSQGVSQLHLSTVAFSLSFTLTPPLALLYKYPHSTAPACSFISAVLFIL